jgi:RES domain-containing protein
LRFQGTCFRAHDPKWSFRPLSGEGAAILGGRFNPKGMSALYLGLSIETAIKEANQGFAFKIVPYVLCSYEVDCDDVTDLTTDKGRAAHGVALTDMSCAWFSFIADGKEPPSWRVARRLIAAGCAGLLAPSFAPGATEADRNLVLWDWSDRLPHKVTVFDPADDCRRISCRGSGAPFLTSPFGASQPPHVRRSQSK